MQCNKCIKRWDWNHTVVPLVGGVERIWAARIIIIIIISAHVLVRVGQCPTKPQ